MQPLQQHAVTLAESHAKLKLNKLVIGDTTVLNGSAGTV